MTPKRFLIIASSLVGVGLLLYFTIKERTAPVTTIHTKGGPREQGENAANKKSAFGSGATPIPSVAGVTLTAQDQEKMQKMMAVFGAPIIFFGKVADQTGKPVTGANVLYSAADQYFGGSTKYTGVSDTDGLFSLRDAKGAGLYVEVSKDGYERIPNRSYRSFGYGMPSGDAPPSRDNPALFILRKKGVAEGLLKIDRDIVIPKDGTPVEVSLATGRAVEHGDFRIECWADNASFDPNLNQRYSWRCRLSVPGGGMLQRVDQFNFEAPENGYAASAQIDMPQNAANWSKNFAQEYFVRLSGNRYARMEFRITSGRNQFATIRSYLNPSGSRNLEFDPAKVVNPP
jgi:hypothetical protein